VRGRFMTGVALVLSLTPACGEAGSGSVETSQTGVAVPPPVVVRNGGTVLSLEPFTYCWTGDGSAACADGVAPTPLPDLGRATGPVTVSFDRTGWEFTAALYDPSDECRIQIPARVAASGDRSWVLEPAGPADTYRVDLSGRGPEGDVIVSFTVERTLSGPLPAPAAQADIFYPNDGQPETTGEMRLSIRHLATTPAHAMATLTITASDRTVSTFRLETVDTRCVPRGQVGLVGAGPARGTVTQTVGPAPYLLAVELELDGGTYLASAQWPDDLDEETTSVPLTFRPDLPAS
jgi:hypothetical protein